MTARHRRKRKARRRGKEKAKRRPQARPQVTPDAQGFDYGTGFGTALLGDVEFPSLLGKANVRAVAYGFQWDPEFNVQLPLVSLIAESSEHLAEAFKHFSAWAKGSDGDAVDLSWVFLRNGGYLFGLGPEAGRLQERCLGFHRHVAVRVTTAPLWIKPIDTCGPNTLAFRRYCEVLGSPFLFGAASCSLPTHALPDATHGDFHPLEGVVPIRKLSATLVDQDDVHAGSFPWLALQLHRRGKRLRREPPPFDPATFFRDRRTILTAHFPVTLERIRVLASERADLAKLFQDFAPWQVEQAICNLLLSYALFERQPHYPGVRSPDLPNVIGQALAQRVEQADGDSSRLRELRPEVIRKQIELDSLALLVRGSPKRRPPTNVQAALRLAGVLDPQDSLVSR
jgi:hypothetical protein